MPRYEIVGVQPPDGWMWEVTVRRDSINQSGFGYTYRGAIFGAKKAWRQARKARQVRAKHYGNS